MDTLRNQLPVKGPQTDVCATPVVLGVKPAANLRERHRTGRSRPGDWCVHHWFEAQVERTPDAVAVGFENTTLTYRELNTRSSQLAHHLRSLGVGAEVRVGLGMERSLEMIIGMLAILKAGGAYVPLDPAQPAERLLGMAEDSGARVILANQNLNWSPPAGARVVRLDNSEPPFAPPPAADRPEGAGAEGLAYVMYTSGSTGRPKGVCVPHRAIVRLVRDTDYVRLGPADVVAQASNTGFDAATFEIWGALLNGARLEILPLATLLAPGLLAAQLRARRVTTLFVTTALFNLLARAAPGIFQPLEQVLFGGEQADVRTVRAVLQNGPPRRLLHVYGPTETTTFATWQLVKSLPPGAATVPIGHPIANTTVYLLDANRQPVAEGEPGEIHIGGDGVARGYLHQAALTAERFIPDPFSRKPDARLYRTGDLARRQSDGSLEFIGRMDQQVKIRGFRVELGEIEAALTGQPEVGEAVVVVQEMLPGEKQLVAYLSSTPPTQPDVASLRARLAIKLPSYMVPARFVAVSALPLNSNGKVDRAALAQIDGVELGMDTEPVAPKDDLERTLVEIWQVVLRRDRVGVQDNFFDLGGHSLLAVGICAQICRRLQFEVPLRWVFEQPTIRLLARQLTALARPVVAAEGILPADRSQPLPMSFGQQQMWLLQQSLPDPATYNQPIVCRLTGRVDGEKVRHALGRIQERHEVLRTALHQSGADLVQVVVPTDRSTVPWLEQDLTGVARDQQEAVWQERLLEESRRPFDLAVAPLWRVLWLKLAEAGHVLAFIFHHGIMDEWSLRLLVRELELSYPAGGPLETATLPALPVQYADFAVWQNRRLSTSRREELRQYWQEQLRDLPPPLELPADRPKPLQPTGRGAVHRFQINGATMHGLRQQARQEKTTLFTLILAAWQVLLHRHTGQTDLLVGIPVALRDRPETQPLLGYFLNTLPVRTRVTGSQCFQELAGQVRDTHLGGISHSDLPIDKIAELVGQPSGSGQSGLFQVMFVLLEEGLPAMRLGSALAQWVPASTHTSKYDLLLSIQTGETMWDCHLEYATDRFTAERAASLAGHFTELLQSIVAGPQAPINQLKLLPAAEHEHLLAVGRGPEIDYPADQCVHQLFEAQTAQTPEAVALIFENQTLTYRELNRRANQLAHHLRSRDVGPDTLVGLCVERSLDMCVGVLGILKAGAAYVPLDPSLPAERLGYLISNAECGVVITQNSKLEQLAPCVTAIEPAPLLVLLETATLTTRAGDAANPVPLAGRDHLAYVLYTSGSTGRPKGVEMPHRPLVNLIHWQRSISALGPGDRTLQFASLGFDVSFQEMFATWATGGTLVVVPPELRINPAGLLAALDDWRINRLFLPFVMLEQLAEADRHRPFPPAHLKEVSVAGEQLRIGPAIRRFFERIPGSRLWNHYGPAEAHVVTSHELAGPPSAWPDLPVIGRPLPNCDILLLDDRRQLVPAGVIGELYIGGVCLARGYRQRPDLTMERFTPHPFRQDPAARLYRTGDLARWQGNGTLEFLGRADHQVKIRGFRVELGELEAVLGGHPDVAACVVVAEESAHGSKALAAYLVAREGTNPAGGAIRSWLKEKLPNYMIPARLVSVPALPLNANGKVERLKLRHLAGVELPVGNDWQAPNSERERVLVEIWQAGLRQKLVGVQDNFFDLGGHSLLAAVICSQINQRLGLTVPLRWLFEEPTIARLAKRMDSLASQASGDAKISRVARPGKLPMSFGQQGLWLQHQTLVDPATYNQPMAWRLPGRVDRQLVQRCLAVIQGRHEVLRTALVLAGEDLVQAVTELATAPLPWQEFDLSEVPDASQETALAALLTAEARRAFDLAQAPLWRVAWITLGGEDHVLGFTFHHAIIDEWSLRRLFAEFQHLYAANGDTAQAGLPELPVQYADFATWQRQQLSGMGISNLMGYWQKQLAELPPALELPRDQVRTPPPSNRGLIHGFQIARPIILSLRKLARQENTTMFTVMMAAFHVWLHRLTGQSDILVGTPLANRERPELQSLLGFFLNSLPIRSHLQGTDSFRVVVRQVRETVLTGFDHGRLPFEKMVELSRSNRVAGPQALFETVFVLLEENPPSLRLGEVAGMRVPMPTQTSKHDLALSLQAGETAWAGEFEYSTDLFTSERVTVLAGQFGELLRSLATQPETPIGQLNLLPPEERRRMVVEWNGTGRDYPPEKCLPELFEAQVRRTPDAVAVEFEDQSLTYQELDQRANQLARHLIKLGVRPETRVALCLERSLEMVVAIYGTVKAGAAYVPLDSDYPAERIAFMLADANAPVILTQESLREKLSRNPARLVCLDHRPWPGEEEVTTAPETGVTAENLAYVIYTSGSTGQPKGVMNTHRGIVNYLQWKQETYALTVTDCVLQKTPFSFDVSVWEFFWPLQVGARLVIARPGGHRDSHYLIQTIVRQQITTLHFVPAMLRWFLEVPAAAQCTSLRRVFCGGESLPWDLHQAFFERFPGVALFNRYGPTEAAVNCTHWACQPDSQLGFVPIGRPIANTQIYLLDPTGQPVAAGMAGELYIGGAGVARGYHNRPELTAEKFVADPFRPTPGARLFRTGDRARFLPDGNIEFLGRMDHQIKLRGFRIELGEIETALSTHPLVAANVVLAQTDERPETRLTAFLVLREDTLLSVTTLRNWLGGKLPDHMIPSRFVTLTALPLTPNGKLDRGALAKLSGSELETGTSHVEPRNPHERLLVGIWEQVLHREQVGVRDNFFHLGGHSLLAIMMCSQIKRELGLEVPLRWVFEHPTVEDLANQMARPGGSVSNGNGMGQADRRQPLPMSFGQQQMWLVQQHLADAATYNLPVVWRLAGEVSRETVRAAWQVLLERHEVLRTALVANGPNLMQQVTGPEAIALPWEEMDFSHLPASEAEAAGQARLLDEVRRPFDLGRMPLWRALWIQLAGQEQILALTFHHSIMDEWSLRVIFKELEKLYLAGGRLEPAGLPELLVQYADYAVWQRGRMAESRRAELRAFWEHQLHELPPALELPADLTRPIQPTGRGALYAFHLSGPLGQGLRELAHAEGTTLFTVMLAAYQAWLWRQTGQNDLIIGTPKANREWPEVQDIPGYFLNTLAIRARLDGHQSFREAVRQTRETLLAAFNHSDAPFDQVVDWTVKERGTGQPPLFKTMFVLLEEGQQTLRLGPVAGQRMSVGTRTSKYDLILSLQTSEEDWRCQWEYSTECFTPGRVASLAAHLGEMLASISQNPDQPISRLNLLAPAEREQILVEWNRTERNYPRVASVPELFAAQAERTPGAVAVVCGEDSLTYGELHRRAAQVAGHLRRHGIGPGELVGLQVERSLEMIIGVLGILLAGGAYWALEENLPEHRLRLMLAEARPRVLLGNRKSSGLLTRLGNPAAAGISPPTVAVIEDWLEQVCEISASPGSWPRAEDPIYVSYTSGSTGQPKGVVVPQRGVVRLVKGTDYASLTAGEVFLQLSPLSFDASTFEIWGALLNGGRLALMPPGTPALADIAQAIRHHRVTTLWLTAGLFHLMVDEQLAALTPLRQLLAGGDVLSPEHVRRARRALPGCRIINGYGPTENTTFTCCHTVGDECEATGGIPIGRPIANTRVYVLDAAGQPVPAGVPGELYAGGDGVACGYLNQPDLTALCFVPDPFSNRPGDRLYRTGDRVRWRNDGTLEFMGRADQQVKIRGFRVELGEIEATLTTQPEIGAAVVLVRETPPGDKQLVAYVVPRTAARLDPATLRGRLAGKLPDYMVPAHFVWLEQLPLTPNGKIDRRALPAPDSSGQAPTGRADRRGNLLEMELTRIWQRLFQREDIGQQDNFFALGGHSLQAVRLAAEIDKLTGCKLPSAALFQSPTIESLARRLADEQWAPPWSSLVPLQPRGAKPPLFFLHGVGGDVYCFVELAGLLGPDQPVYGIQAAGVDGRCPRHVSMEQMAAHYVREITSFQPEGPVYLAGYSLGGVIAWEVSRQLQSAGRRVAFLGLLDSSPLGGVPWFFYGLAMMSYLPRRCLVHIGKWWGLPVGEKFKYLAGRRRALAYWWRNNQAGPALADTPPPLSIEPPKVQGYCDYYVAVASSCRLKPNPGPASIFVSDQAKSGWRWYWRFMARGGVSFHPVPGSHHDILKPRYLPVLVATLRTVLEQKQAAAGAVPLVSGPPHATSAK